MGTLEHKFQNNTSTNNEFFLPLTGPYETYEGSPVSKGILQHDMWNVKPSNNRWDWDTLRARIAQHGVRNSLLIAPMPTASTSQVQDVCQNLL